MKEENSKAPATEEEFTTPAMTIVFKGFGWLFVILGFGALFFSAFIRGHGGEALGVTGIGLLLAAAFCGAIGGALRHLAEIAHNTRIIAKRK